MWQNTNQEGAEDGQMKKAKSDVGLRIKQLRGERGLTQDKLAKLSDTAPAQLSRYEAGKNSPSSPVLARLARALDVSVLLLHTGGLPEANDILPVCAAYQDMTKSTILEILVDRDDAAMIPEMATRFNVSEKKLLNELLLLGMSVYESCETFYRRLEITA